MQKTPWLQVWGWIDPMYYSCTRLQCVNPMKDNVFRVRLMVYRGKPMTLDDGSTIDAQDTLMKIHLHNVKLLKTMQQTDNDLKKAVYLYRTIERSMPDLARYVRNHPEAAKIKGILGITMLNRGCERLGFETRPIETGWYKQMKWMAMAPIYYLSTASPSFRQLQNKAPEYLVMSKQKLLDTYSP